MDPPERACAPTRSSNPHPWVQPPGPRLKPGPVFVTSGGVVKLYLVYAADVLDTSGGTPVHLPRTHHQRFLNQILEPPRGLSVEKNELDFRPYGPTDAVSINKSSGFHAVHATQKHR